MEIIVKNRLTELFERKKENVLSVYFTSGYPELDDTIKVISALETAGADIIEVGIPYSDPIADGPTIQASNTIALNNGISLPKIFDQLKEMRSKIQIPIVMMGYLNPIAQFGIKKFCKKCEEVGVDGIIVPDLPMSEYLEEYKSIFSAHGLLNIFLITPQTSEGRIREIDHNTEGFIYMVSSASVTGAKSGISDEQKQYFDRVNSMGLKNPTLIGFGISNKETFQTACQFANGAIIGSAFIKILENTQNLEKDITSYIHSIIE